MEKPLRRGDVVTFTYENISHQSIPVNPEILRIRCDISWEEVVENFSKSPQTQTLDSMYPPFPYFPHSHFRFKARGSNTTTKRFVKYNCVNLFIAVALPIAIGKSVKNFKISSEFPPFLHNCTLLYIYLLRKTAYF
jgi:hypothetical protein